jgi:DNA repair exonuclease SbcCD ATPase subunit
LNYSIKEAYNDFIKNVETEYNLINSIESKSDKSNYTIIEEINYLRIYIDLDKKSLDDFFEEAKKIFKKLKILFNSLKQIVNSNINQYHYINNIFPQQITENNYKINNNNILRNYNNNAKILKSKTVKTPLSKSFTTNSSYKLLAKNSLKKTQKEISEKDKKINYLQKKLKILEQNNTKLFRNFNAISSQKIDYEKKLKELTSKYEQLQKKFILLEQNTYDYRTEEKKNSNYEEEELDLKKMAKGAKEKNFSQDMNIDYPGLLSQKEKIKEVIYKYNTLVELVKTLIPNVNQNESNRSIINDIIKAIFGRNP